MSVPNASLNIQTFNSLFEDHFDGLKKHLKKIERPDKRNIHAFRVWVKHFRNSLEVAEILTHHQTKRKDIYKSLKPIYKSAGQLRRLQIHKNITKNLNLQKEVKNEIEGMLHKSVSKAAKELQHELKRFHASSISKNTKKIFRYLDDDSPDIQAELMNKIIRDLKNDIQEKLVDGYGSDNLHSIRKDLKNLIYTTRMRDKIQTDFLVERSGMIEVKKLESELGIYNDLRGYVTFLETCDNIKLQTEIDALIGHIDRHLENSRVKLARSLQAVSQYY